jgi:hypothetical protein
LAPSNSHSAENEKIHFAAIEWFAVNLAAPARRDVL